MLENLRLEALARSGLMDTPPEEEFDRLTRLAAQATRTPVSLLTCVDNDRQFFKSSFGIDGLAPGSSLTLLRNSLCKHVVFSAAPFIVPDARTQPVLERNEAVADLHFRAYLGAPVKDEHGFVLAALGVIDRRPRSWNGVEIQSVLDCAAAASAQLALRALSIREQGRMVKTTKAREASPDVFCLLDAEHRIVEVGARAQELLGYQPEELIGRNLAEVLAHDDSGGTTEKLDKLVQGEARANFENDCVHKDGSRRRIQWSAIWSETDQTFYAIARDEPIPAGLEATGDASKSILVVDDYREIGLLVQTALQFAGYGKIDVVNSPIRAIELVQQNRYDMVIADLRMEPMNGVDLLFNIRSQRGMENVPVLIISGYSSRDVVEKMKQVGVDGFVAKPFTARDLARRVDLAFRHRAGSAANLPLFDQVLAERG